MNAVDGRVWVSAGDDAFPVTPAGLAFVEETRAHENGRTAAVFQLLNVKGFVLPDVGVRKARAHHSAQAASNCRYHSSSAGHAKTTARNGAATE